METKCETWSYEGNNLSLDCNLYVLDMIPDGSSNAWSNTTGSFLQLGIRGPTNGHASEANNSAGGDVSLSIGVKTTISVLLVFSLLGGFLGNSVVCIIVYQKPAMRSAINLLLSNMAVTHIFLVVLCTPFALITLWMEEWVFQEPVCILQAFFHQLFICEAMSVLMAISIDRYLIIVLKKDKLTPAKAKIMIGISWSMSAALSFPPVIGWGNFEYKKFWMQCTLTSYDNADIVYVIVSLIVIFFAPMSLLSYTYLSIIETVRKRSTRVQPRNCLESIPGGQVTQLGLSVITRPPNKGVDMRFKTRTFKTILLLFVVYVVCWLPYSSAMLHWNIWKQHEAMSLPGNFLLTFGYMNSAINPCIYCWRIKKFREACQDLLPGMSGFCPRLPQKTKRRIDPSGPYKVEPAM